MRCDMSVPPASRSCFTALGSASIMSCFGAMYRRKGVNFRTSRTESHEVHHRWHPDGSRSPVGSPHGCRGLTDSRPVVLDSSGCAHALRGTPRAFVAILANTNQARPAPRCATYRLRRRMAQSPSSGTSGRGTLCVCDGDQSDLIGDEPSAEARSRPKLLGPSPGTRGPPLCRARGETAIEEHRPRARSDGRRPARRRQHAATGRDRTAALWLGFTGTLQHVPRATLNESFRPNLPRCPVLTA